MSAGSPARRLYWSVRREVWESRSIQVAPAAVAAVVLLGALGGTATLPRRLRALPALPTAEQVQAIVLPFDALAGLLAVTSVVVGAFYSLEALHGERRDRSILFWKSLPVSDRVAVLAKASVPLVVLPLWSFALAVAAQVVLLLASTAVLLAGGVGIAPFWEWVALPGRAAALAYGMAAITLWHVPTYAWLLLVSAWARRAPVLWAVLPLLAATVFEWVAFRTSRLAGLLRYRADGWFTRGFAVPGPGDPPAAPLEAVTPGRLLGDPDPWLGLAFAAACLAGAAWLRRRREPL